MTCLLVFSATFTEKAVEVYGQQLELEKRLNELVDTASYLFSASLAMPADVTCLVFFSVR